jgi:hypothetical protein
VAGSLPSKLVRPAETQEAALLTPYQGVFTGDTISIPCCHWCEDVASVRSLTYWFEKPLGADETAGFFDRFFPQGPGKDSVVRARSRIVREVRKAMVFRVLPTLGPTTAT